VVSVDGALGHEEFFFCSALLNICLVVGIKVIILMWICVHLAFTVIRATNLCLRGSHVCWQCGTSIDDGACLPNVSLDHK